MTGDRGLFNVYGGGKLIVNSGNFVTTPTYLNGYVVVSFSEKIICDIYLKIVAFAQNFIVKDYSVN